MTSTGNLTRVARMEGQQFTHAPCFTQVLTQLSKVVGIFIQRKHDVLENLSNG